MTTPASPEVSVVIPTYQRREVVLNTLRHFEHQVDAPSFEIVVSIDGSNDGTLEALESFESSFPLTIEFHENRGLPFTRNAGAARATGRIILFMDDDMEPAPTFVAGHHQPHTEGADVVIGPMPLHPDSPDNLLSTGVGMWADEHEARLSDPAHKIRFIDIFGGHLSIGREALDRIGGYDETMRSCEDHEFGIRAIDAGLDIRFNPDARAYQMYVVDSADHLVAHRKAGEADVEFVAKHPSSAELLFTRHDDVRSTRLARRPTLRFPRAMEAVAQPLGRVTGKRIDDGHTDKTTARLFFAAKSILYWVGVADAGGMP